MDAKQFARSCWHDICIGRTTLTQAEAELRADADLITNVRYKSTLLCWGINGIPDAEGCATPSDQHSNHVIEQLYLKFDPEGSPITIGDLIALVGKPIESQICMDDRTIWNPNIPPLVINLSVFNEGRVRVESQSATDPMAWRLDPTQKVVNLYFLIFDLQGAEVHWKWRGFVTAPGHARICAG